MSKNESKIVHVHLPVDEPFKTTLTAGRHEITADEPKDVEGGNNQGPDPYDLLLMSLGSCTVMTVKMYARRKGYPLKNLYAELKHHKKHGKDCKHCEDSQSKIDHIELELIAEGNLSKKQMDKMLSIAQKCPVNRTLTSDINIEHSIDHRNT